MTQLDLYLELDVEAFEKPPRESVKIFSPNFLPSFGFMSFKRFFVYVFFW